MKHVWRRRVSLIFWTIRAACLCLGIVAGLALASAGAYCQTPPQGDVNAKDKQPPKPAVVQAQPTAFAQLGSPRFRHPGPVFHAAFAPDGKTLATAALGSVSVWETATGKLLRRVVRAHAPFHRVAFSADGKTLHAVIGPTEDGCELLTLDPTSGKERSRLVIRKVVYGGAEFSVGGARLAVFSKQEVEAVLIDLAVGKELARVPAYWRGTGLTPDGKRLVLAHGNEVVRVLDALTGKEVDKFKAGDRRPDWVQFAPGGALLLAGSNWVQRWDRKRNVSIWMVDLLASGGGLEVSPDGKWVAYVSRYGITLLNVETGKKGFSNFNNGFYSSAQFSPDGRIIAVSRVDGVLELRDSATGKPLAQSPELSGGVGGLTFSADGKTLSAAAGDQWVSWDLTPAVPDSRSSSLGQFTLLAPGGRTGIRPNTYEKAAEPAEFVDARSGKRTHLLNPPETGDTVVISQFGDKRGRFSGDGRRYFGQRQTKRGDGGQQSDLGLGVWDVATGKRIADLVDKQGLTVITAVSFDGKAVVVQPRRPGMMLGAGATSLAVWEPDTGRLRWTRDLPLSFPFVAFTRGGSRLVVQEFYPTRPPGGFMMMPAALGLQAVLVLDAATGKEILKANGPFLGPQPLVYADEAHHMLPVAQAVAPDGRTVAIAGYDGTIYLWDLLTDSERCRIAHPGPVHELVFSPDGRTLAAASLAAPVVLYDVYGIRGAVNRKPDKAALARAWDDLGSLNGAVGFRAVRTFVAAGSDGVQFLRERMRGVPHPPPGQIAGWIKDLGSKNFKTRTQAMDALTKVIRRAEPRLQKALQKPESLEVATRLRQLLAAAGKPDAEELRAVRAVEAVDMIGAPQAAKVLAEWATGSDDVLQREASVRWREGS